MYSLNRRHNIKFSSSVDAAAAVATGNAVRSNALEIVTSQYSIEYDVCRLNSRGWGSMLCCVIAHIRLSNDD